MSENLQRAMYLQDLYFDILGAIDLATQEG